MVSNPLEVSDYNGFIPLDPKLLEEPKSPISSLVDEMVQKTNEARQKILSNLIENPGVAATFHNGFDVEFGDVEIRTSSHPLDDTLNNYHLEIVQKWRIVHRKVEDVNDRTALGGNSRGEERPDRQDSGKEQPTTHGLRLLP